MMLAQRMSWYPEADLGALRSERLLRAHTVNSVFALRALAAHKLLQAHYSLCRNAAARTAIHAHCCEDQSIKDRVVD